MSNTIQPSYGTQAYGVPTKARGAKQTGTQANRFLDMAARASRSTADVLEISRPKVTNEAKCKYSKLTMRLGRWLQHSEILGKIYFLTE